MVRGLGPKADRLRLRMGLVARLLARLAARQGCSRRGRALLGVTALRLRLWSEAWLEPNRSVRILMQGAPTHEREPPWTVAHCDTRRRWRWPSSRRSRCSSRPAG